ncbi:tRNA (adenosine(37)-N6)-threonylcarbamoyltransferase complex ATPase subunit type 1 TsaE [Hirschia litorea]|uniref:tRNA threonylcarbamoyladenosine biosynthesis protein TsaE n=1 Tax=Hirschia litorea TaxID=1199156 RepID=A0ABW2IKV2_9PROT
MPDDANSKKFSLKSEADTFALAQSLAPILRVSDVIALYGDLGAGKTTFARALIRTLLSEAQMDVPSPTFTIVQTYDAPQFPIWHFDMYRIEDESELDELGLDETIDGLTLIEWPSRMGEQLPTYRLDITLDLDATGRSATLTGHGEDWIKRLANFS